MNKQLRNRWIKACDVMLDYYEGRINFDDLEIYRHDCPFCQIAYWFDGGLGFHECPDCLWRIFKKTSCIEYTKKYYHQRLIEDLKSKHYPSWVRSSIKRIKGWKKRLQKNDIPKGF